jgi:hypothetical protein
VRADREIGSVAGAATRVALIGAGKFRIGRHAGERFECALQGLLEHARDPEAASRKGQIRARQRIACGITELRQ